MKEYHTFVIDIDNTILNAKLLNNSDVYDYQNAEPIIKMIDKINELYKNGHKIILFTSRGMRTFNGNVKLISSHHRPILHKWLNEHKVKYDALLFGKPWDINVHYIDDKNMTFDEFHDFKDKNEDNEKN